MTNRGLILLPMLAGALAGVGQAPLNWGVPMFLGAMAVYALVRQAPPTASAFGIGWRFGLGYFAVALHWIVEPFFVDLAATGWMAPFALILMVGGLALFWGAGVWLAARLGRGALVFAASLALVELARAYLFSGFPWAMPAYAWVGSPVALLSAWFGPHGLNFALFAAAALAVHLYQARRMWLYRLTLALVVAASLAPVPRAVLPEHGTTVRLIQPNAPQDQKWLPEMEPTFFQRQLNFTSQPGAPDYVIWPETAIVPPFPYAAEEFTAMSDAAGDAQIITGLRRVDGPLYFNSLIVLDDVGHAIQGYDKHHLVPFGEYMPLGETLARFGIRGLAAKDGAGFAAGDGPKLLDLDGLGAVLPLICYEVVFPQDLRTDLRPDLLLQITNDAWFGEFSGPYQHLAQARMRAIELGLPLIRVANTGVSAVIGPWGNVLAQIPLGQAGYLDSTVPPARAETIYAQTGDWAVMVLLFAAIAVAGLRRRRNTIDASRARN